MADLVPAAEQLRARLKKLEWSQLDLATAIGVNPGVVSRWLSGERTPSLEMAFRIERSKIGIPAEAWITHADVDDSGPHKIAKTESTDSMTAVVDPRRRSSG